MIKILLNHIPNITPVGFRDFIITDATPIEDEFFKISLETEGLVKFKNGVNYLTRPIQKVIYQKYKLEIPDAQAERLELIELGSKVYILDDEELTKEVVVTNISRTFSNQMWVVTIEYYDISANEYTRQVAEYLKSEYLKSSGEYSTYDLYYTPTEYISTRLEPIDASPDFENETTKVNEIEVTNKSVQSIVDKYTFYCSGAEVRSLKENMYKYLPSVDGVTAKELVKPKIDKLEGWDIYKVEIDIIKNKLIYKI